MTKITDILQFCPLFQWGVFFYIFCGEKATQLVLKPKIITLNQIFLFFYLFFQFGNLENQNKFILPFISMGGIFYFWGGEGHPLSTDTKNHNSKSNISIFLFLEFFENSKKNRHFYFWPGVKKNYRVVGRVSGNDVSKYDQNH